MTSIFRSLFHYAAYLLGAVVIVISMIALSLRFVIMPDIDRYRPTIERAASEAIGLTVGIAAIEADWWHINPRFSLRGVTLMPRDGRSQLGLARVDATLSWLSLAFLEPRLAQLHIHQPSLEIRRDKTGALFVAGIPVKAEDAPSPFPDWVLRQQNVTVADGRITWIDEFRDAPPLVLEQVNLRIANLFGRHRFGLTATPPAEAGHHLDIRGALTGASVHRLEDWSGQIYLAVSGASAEALHAWSPWAQTAVRRSVGDLRFWMDLGRGQVSGVVGDVRLAGVAVSLADDLPEMSFRTVSGRMGWRRKGSEQTYHVDKLRFVTADGRSAEPASVRVTVERTDRDAIATAKVAADSLRLEALTALSGSLPLPRTAHDWIAGLNPRGFVEHIEFDWLGRERFRLQARFRDAGLNATGEYPGISGLSGEIETDERTGKARLTSTAMRFVDDRVFRQPLDFDRIEASLDWQATGQGGYRIVLDHCELGNADLDGTAVGTLVWQPGQSPVIDLGARLSRGHGNAVWRYLPRAVADDAYEWLKRGLVAGVSPDTRLTLRGPLDRFPFDRGGGEFQVDVRMRDATLDYAPGWPVITGINGLLTFKNKAMHITTESGRILGVDLGRVEGIIPDLHYSLDETLTIDGTASGPTPAFLEFIRQSPVDEHTGHFTGSMRASGTTNLSLQLRLPLRRIRDSQVAGLAMLAGNQIRIDDRLPPLDRVTGSLRFTESWLKGDGISAQIYGIPVLADLASETGGRLRASLKGRFTAAVLGQWLPAALGQRITGATDIRADLTLKQGALDFTFASSLEGLAMNLPAPFGKAASQNLPFKASGRSADTHPASLTFQHGNIVSGALSMPDRGPGRVGLVFGGQAATLPTGPGLSVQGNLRQLDLDAWRALDLGTTGGGGTLPIRDISLSFNELKVYGRKLREIHVQARPKRDTWHLRLSGQDIIGDLEYGPSLSQPGNRFSGRFERLAIPRDPPSGSAQPDGGDPGELPTEIDLVVKSFAYKGRPLGELTTSLRQERNGLRIDAFTLANPDGRLEASGWLSASPMRVSNVELKLDSPSLGQLMQRLGYIEAVKGGRLHVDGRLAWPGRPEEIDLAHLDGSLNVDIGGGRFTRLDPGAAKLLGILSLQALPRRIVLDFRDVFSEGFTFDLIRGGVHLERGIAYLPGLDINGPSAKIRMNGKIDPFAEKQELRLLIQPRLDEGLAMGAAILGGPVAGVGTFVASKLLRDPLAKAASFEYLVGGTWDDPVVRKLGRNNAAETPENAP